MLKESVEQSQDVEATIETKWGKNPTVSDLKQYLLDANPMHETQKEKIVEWLDNLNVTGKAKLSPSKTNSTIVPKLIRKQAEWRYGSLSEPFLSTDEIFNVRPTTWEDREAAKQNQLVLNYQFNTHIDKTEFIDEYVRAAVDEGTVVIRTGWAFEEEQYKETVPVFEYRENPELAPMMEQIGQMQQESPSQYATDVPEELKQAFELSQEHGVPIEPVMVGEEEVTKTRTLYNKPTAEICNLQNLVIDPTCKGNIRNAGFVIYSFETSLTKLKQDKKYKNLDKIVVSSNSILGEADYDTSDGSKNFKFKDKSLEKFVVYEFWGNWDIDGKGKVIPIVAAWAGNTLIRLEENPYPDKGLPFVSVQYLPVRKSVYGEPDGALLEDNQKVLGAVTRGMVDILGKSANGQTGMRKDMLDTTNKRKFDKGQDYEFNSNVDPRLGVFMHTYPEIPRSAQFMLQMQNVEAESLTGVKSYAQSGVSGASLGDVAAGVRGALDAASKRELGILRRLSAGIVEVGRKFISMNSELLEEEEVVRITNEEFVTVRRDDLAGNFDLRLSISTAEEDDNKAQELAFMLQTMGNNMDPGLSKMILSDIANLRKMPDLAKKIENYEPQPDPMAEQRAQLELQTMAANLEMLQARTQTYLATAQMHSARAGSEEAKAGNLNSDTDLKNLNFVEQEAGVQQERELQKHGAQAKSQQETKLMERQFALEDKEDQDTKDYLKMFLDSQKGK